MTCPTCSSELHTIRINDSKNGGFDIDHCGKCGGTWFDPYEINRLDYHEVVRLAHQTVWRNSKMGDWRQHPRCPRDSHLLSPYESGSLPAGTKFLRCNACFGIWATQKSLEMYKKTQDEKNSSDMVQKKVSAFPALSLVLVPALLLMLLLLSTFLTIYHLSGERDSRILAQNYVQNLKTTRVSPFEVAISFETPKNLRSQITFGKTLLLQDSKWMSLDYTTFHSILLNILEPGESYIFTITLEDESGRSYTTEQHQFSTK